MYRIVLALLLLAVVIPSLDARGRTSTSHKPATSHSTKAKARPAARSKAKCASCARDAKGRIARSAAAKHSFQKSHPCPSTGRTTGACRGYVIDHIVPLKRGGTDTPSNMQWQTNAAAKAKDKVE